MATHSTVLAWRISGTGSLVGCHLWGRTESDTTEATQQQQFGEQFQIIIESLIVSFLYQESILSFKTISSELNNAILLSQLQELSIGTIIFLSLESQVENNFFLRILNNLLFSSTHFANEKSDVSMTFFIFYINCTFSETFGIEKIFKKTYPQVSKIILTCV